MTSERYEAYALAYKTLNARTTATFNRAALNEATLSLHTQPSTIGRLKTDLSGKPDAVGTHLLLNIAFMHAAVCSPRDAFEKAFADFAEEAQRQNLDIVPEDVRADTLRIAHELHATVFEDCINCPQDNDSHDGPSLTSGMAA